MVVTLPIATILRILDRVTILREQASEFILGEALARVIRADVETNSPTQTTKPLPKLPENIVSALEKARADKTLIDDSKHVGHLRRDEGDVSARALVRNTTHAGVYPLGLAEDIAGLLASQRVLKLADQAPIG